MISVPCNDYPDQGDTGKASEAPEARQLEQMTYPTEDEQRCSPIHDFDVSKKAAYQVSNLWGECELQENIVLVWTVIRRLKIKND